MASSRGKVDDGVDKNNQPKFKTAMVDFSGQSKLVSLTHRMDGASAVVEGKFEGPLTEARWTILPGGWIQLDYQYSLGSECDLAGVQFDYPENQMKSIRWLGRGPYRAWKNRTNGLTWDVWQNAWNDSIPGESWLYPEFKGYFGEFQWAVFQTSEGAITLLTPQEHCYLGVYKPHEGKQPKGAEVFTPPTGLALLDAIPPIGNKFMGPEKVGPQSQPNPAPGTCRRTVWLRFE